MQFNENKSKLILHNREDVKCIYAFLLTQTFFILPPDFFTINSSTIDWRQVLIMIAWNHKYKANFINRINIKRYSSGSHDSV